MSQPVTWPQVVLALVVAIPSIIAAVAALVAARNGKATRAAVATSNGKTIGAMVEDVHAVTTPDSESHAQPGPPAKP